MTEILKISLGSTNKSSAILVATPNTIMARSALISSPLNLLAASTPNCAPITEAIIPQERFLQKKVSIMRV